jgi:hypothetical protein
LQRCAQQGSRCKKQNEGGGEQALGYDNLNAFLQDGCVFSMARKITQNILEGVAVIAGGI